MFVFFKEATGEEELNNWMGESPKVVEVIKMAVVEKEAENSKVMQKPKTTNCSKAESKSSIDMQVAQVYDLLKPNWKTSTALNHAVVSLCCKLA
jgi:hypothetical protein